MIVGAAIHVPCVLLMRSLSFRLLLCLDWLMILTVGDTVDDIDSCYYNCNFTICFANNFKFRELKEIQAQ